MLQNMPKAKVGIIGCGNIAQTYGELAPLFHNIILTACADICAENAAAFAQNFDVQAMTVTEILASDADVIVNLTIPAAHAEVTKQILNAGKHAYSEKPLGISPAEGLEILETAQQTGKRVGCAPDTFLGGGPQQARHLVDQNIVGIITSGTVHVMGHGVEMWHPNPSFFYQPGGGPVMDMGPYYISLLIHLLGPVRRVAAMANKGTETRTITSELRNGEVILVATPTTLHAVLEFESGAIITLNASWDVWAHGHANPIELYGTNGTLFLPDPNFFGGEIRVASSDGQIRVAAPEQHPIKHPFAVPNSGEDTTLANYRGAGLADMIDAIHTSREHRCSLERARHALDVMAAIIESGETGRFVAMQTTCTRPAALSAQQAQSLLK